MRSCDTPSLSTLFIEDFMIQHDRVAEKQDRSSDLQQRKPRLFALYLLDFLICHVIVGRSQLQGVPQYCFHFVFCHFLGFWSSYRGTSDLYSTALEICYIIATKILKIVLEIAEIIEVKVGTRNTKITFLTLRNSKMSISKLTGANFDLNYLSYF